MDTKCSLHVYALTQNQTGGLIETKAEPIRKTAFLVWFPVQDYSNPFLLPPFPSSFITPNLVISVFIISLLVQIGVIARAFNEFNEFENLDQDEQ